MVSLTRDLWGSAYIGPAPYAGLVGVHTVGDLRAFPEPSVVGDLRAENVGVVRSGWLDPCGITLGHDFTPPGDSGLVRVPCGEVDPRLAVVGDGDANL